MKRFFFVLSMLLTLAITKNYADGIYQNNEFQSACLNVIDGKVYFDTNQVIVSNENLFVLISDVEGNIIQFSVSSLHHDDAGIYILMEEFQSKYYRCRICKMPVCELCNRCTAERCRSGLTCICGGW